MGLSDITDIAVSGLAAQRARITITASNLANAETTRTPEGGPYRRRDPLFRAVRLPGVGATGFETALRAVRVDGVVQDGRDFMIRHMPGHPDADEEGNVLFPNVNIVEEQTNLMSASRAYEANLLLIRKVRDMAEAVMRIGA